MPGFSLTCPECGATLKSAKPVAAGKIITCPKCEVMFAAPKPKPPEAARVEVIDEVEVIEDVEIVGEPKAKLAEPLKHERPRGGPPRARRGKPKRKKMSALALSLLIGGIVLGIGSLALGGVLVWKYVINAPSELVAYVPDDAPIVMGVDFGRINSATQLNQMIDMLLNATPVGQYCRDTGTSSKALLDRAVIVFRGQDEVDAFTVLTRTPIDKDKLIQALRAKAITVGGREAYQFGTGPSAANLVINSPKSVSIVDPAKRNEQLTQDLGKCKPSAAVSAMISKAASNDVWLVIDFESPVMRNEIMKNLPPTMLASGGFDVIRCAGAWIKFADPDVQLTVQYQIKDRQGQSMDQIAQGAKTGFDQLKPMVANLSSSPLVPAQVQPFVPLIGEVVNSMTISSSGDCLVIKAKIKKSVLEAVIMDAGRSMIPSGR